MLLCWMLLSERNSQPLTTCFLPMEKKRNWSRHEWWHNSYNSCKNCKQFLQTMMEQSLRSNKPANLGRCDSQDSWVGRKWGNKKVARIENFSLADIDRRGDAMQLRICKQNNKSPAQTQMCHIFYEMAVFVHCLSYLFLN